MKELDKKYGETLNWQQFRKILQYIENNHSFRKAEGKHIVYVRPDIDMRTGHVFNVQFDYFTNIKVFDFRDSEKSMYNRIMEWLDSKGEIKHETVS